jgi:sugar lactone lactonase YvrE
MAKPRLHTSTWRPPRDGGLRGPFATNTSLADLDILPVPGSGPEDVAVNASGDIFTGTSEGYLLRISRDGSRIDRIAQTGGRPLGIEVHPEGWLVVCDAHRGLLRVDPATGDIDNLVTAVDGVPMRFTNNCAIASDGTIYFSDSSQQFGIDHFKADILAHTRSGRLLRRDPDGSVQVVLDGLAFANGVALAEDESFVLVAETGAYRVTRLELTGDAAGRRSIIIDNLPGLPDNLSTGTAGVFWMALPSARNKLLDLLLPRPGFLRSAVWAMPDRLQPDVTRITWAVGLSGDGDVLHNLQGPGDNYHYVTGVREHGGRLYLGSLVEPCIAVARLNR